MNSTQGEGVSCEAKPRKQGNEAKKFGEEGESREGTRVLDRVDEDLINSTPTKNGFSQVVSHRCLLFVVVAVIRRR